MKESKPNIQKQNCKNCAHPILDSAKYCSSCGQKNTDGRISFSSFVTSFFSTVFNLESKFFQTLGHIFIPGKLTAEYFKGRHKRYFHPVRFFIVSALLLIAAISHQFTNEEMAMNIANIQKTVEKKVRKKDILDKIENASQLTLEKFPERASLKPAFDTLYQTLKGKTFNKKDSVDLNKFIIVKGLDELDFKISNEDFINLSPDELIIKYPVGNYFDRLVFKQKLRLIKDQGSFVPFVLGNSLWIILLMMPFLALILKLLYARHNYYYVEHLVFSFHTHAFAFLLFAIISLTILLGGPPWIIAVGFAILFLYIYKALKRVYGQSRFKTFLKLVCINVAYVLLFSLFFMFGILISMAVF